MYTFYLSSSYILQYSWLLNLLLCCLIFIDKPIAPKDLIGTIQNIPDDTTPGMKAIFSLNLSIPATQNEAAIDYYEVLLIGTHPNKTTCRIVRMTDQSFPIVLPEGNYTAANITAVDLCGQRSEPAPLELINMTTQSTIISNRTITDNCTDSGVCAGLGSGMAVVLLIAIGVITCYLYRCYT